MMDITKEMNSILLMILFIIFQNVFYVILLVQNALMKRQMIVQNVIRTIVIIYSTLLAILHVLLVIIQIQLLEIVQNVTHLV
jgi:hypothetical protein